MRESTPAASEVNDTVTAITRYNYWNEAILLSDDTQAPGTPSATAADIGKQQLLSTQRFDLTASPIEITGTVYRWGVVDGSVHRNGLTGKDTVQAVWDSTNSEWDRQHKEEVRHWYAPFAFLYHVSSSSWDFDANGDVTGRGHLDEYYYYDIMGRLSARSVWPCAETTCSEQDPEDCVLPLDCSVVTPQDIVERTVFYGFDGASSQVLAELGGGLKCSETEVVDWMHATLTPGLFGAAVRQDRSGTVSTLSDDRWIEPMMDAMSNNVSLATSGAAFKFQQTDAYGDFLGARDGVGNALATPLMDVGSFAWRGREGTLNFDWLAYSAASGSQACSGTGSSPAGATGLYRMGDRAYEAAVGRFTQADRLILDGLHPLAANRYLYAMGDPVNFTDPTGHRTLPEVASVAAMLNTIASGAFWFAGSLTTGRTSAFLNAAAAGFAIAAGGFGLIAVLGPLVGVGGATWLSGALLDELLAFGGAAGTVGELLGLSSLTACTWDAMR